MTPLRRKYALIACAGLFALGVALLLHGQSSPNGPNVASLRQELRAHYNIVALQDELALVPIQRNADIKIIEIRDGSISINGTALPAREARQRLGRDADLIFRVTYLDPAAQRDLARVDSAAPQPDVQEKQENEIGWNQPRLNERAAAISFASAATSPWHAATWSPATLWPSEVRPMSMAKLRAASPWSAAR